jgi:hypothetical protein
VFKTQRWLLTVAHPVGAANLALAQQSAALERANVGMRAERSELLHVNSTCLTIATRTRRSRRRGRDHGNGGPRHGAVQATLSTEAT